MSNYRKSVDHFTVTEEELGYECVTIDNFNDTISNIESEVNDILDLICDYDLLRAKERLEELSNNLY
jgi:hypothetical protein